MAKDFYYQSHLQCTHLRVCKSLCGTEEAHGKSHDAREDRMSYEVEHMTHDEAVHKNYEAGLHTNHVEIHDIVHVHDKIRDVCKA